MASLFTSAKTASMVPLPYPPAKDPATSQELAQSITDAFNNQLNLKIPTPLINTASSQLTLKELAGGVPLRF